MSQHEALKQCVEALELHAKQYPQMQKGYTVDAIEAGRAALAEPPGQPVAWLLRIGDSPDWSYCACLEDADFYGEQSGLKYEKKPLYAAPSLAQPGDHIGNAAEMVAQPAEPAKPLPRALRIALEDLDATESMGPTTEAVIDAAQKWYLAQSAQPAEPLTAEQRKAIVEGAIHGHARTRDALMWAIGYTERLHGIKEASK